MRDIGIKVSFEALKGLPVLATKKLILNVTENLLSGAIVNAVALYVTYSG